VPVVLLIGVTAIPWYRQLPLAPSTRRHILTGIELDRDDE